MNLPLLEEQFRAPLLAWFANFGRKDLPWQHPPRNAYRIWVSEIMLQQTQVVTVIPYFNRFMESFPDILSLAAASEDKILSHWSGLGYYGRARNLVKTAHIICDQYQGEFPKDLAALKSLPGIGRSTAAAIASQAFNLPTAILDGNVKRVLSRYFMVDGAPETASVKKHLWDLASQCMSMQHCADYTQAIMDLGATCCKKTPHCSSCPLKKTCLAHLHNLAHDYPAKKVKKTLPIKEQQFLFLYTHDKKIYLEKRSPVGIWGGLWCVPMIEMETCPHDYIKKFYDADILHSKELIQIKHSFTHFHLKIKALAFCVNLRTNDVANGSGKWLTSHEIPHLGLAKPVQTLIKRLQESFGTVQEGH